MRAVISIEGLFLARQIEQMKQRTFIESPGREVLDDQRTGRKRAAGTATAVSARADIDARAGPAGPGRSEMAFARAFRSDQHA